MTTRHALVVRGGWDGHRPVEATGLYIPFLEANGFAVRVEESPDIYADAAVMAATDLVQGLQRGQFFFAGRAPGGPKIEQQRSTFEVCQRQLATLGLCKSQLPKASGGRVSARGRVQGQPATAPPNA